MGAGDSRFKFSICFGGGGVGVDDFSGFVGLSESLVWLMAETKGCWDIELNRGFCGSRSSLLIAFYDPRGRGGGRRSEGVTVLGMNF